MSSFYINFLKAFEKSPIGQLTVTTPEGETLFFKGPQPGIVCDFHIQDWRTVEWVLKRGDVGLGEAYMQGLFTSSNLADFLTYCSINLNLLQNNGNPSLLNRLFFYIYNNFVRINSKRGSKRNILEHYDISNEFYQLWLDSTMTYSSGLRLNENDSLEVAQQNKYQRIIDTLSLKGAQVLEIGCGWGGFAEKATEAGARVTGITISQKQHDYATQRLADKANILLQDYRDIRAKYDRIVSIEMFEAVGERYWSTYFNKIKQALTAGGKALVQTITIAEPYFQQYRKNTDYIRHYVFPGGMLPSKEQFCSEALKAKLQVTGIYQFGKDYAWTLRQWLKNFSNVQDKLANMGYSDRFVRAWKFYLALCIAGFESERTSVMQVELLN